MKKMYKQLFLLQIEYYLGYSMSCGIKVSILFSKSSLTMSNKNNYALVCENVGNKYFSWWKKKSRIVSNSRIQILCKKPII